MIVVPFSYRLTVPELHEILTTAEPTLMIVSASEAHSVRNGNCCHRSNTSG